MSRLFFSAFKVNKEIACLYINVNATPFSLLVNGNNYYTGAQPYTDWHNAPYMFLDGYRITKNVASDV